MDVCVGDERRAHWPRRAITLSPRWRVDGRIRETEREAWLIEQNNCAVLAAWQTNDASLLLFRHFLSPPKTLSIKQDGALIPNKRPRNGRSRQLDGRRTTELIKSELQRDERRIQRTSPEYISYYIHSAAELLAPFVKREVENELWWKYLCGSFA